MTGKIMLQMGKNSVIIKELYVLRVRISSKMGIRTGAMKTRGRTMEELNKHPISFSCSLNIVWTRLTP